MGKTDDSAISFGDFKLADPINKALETLKFSIPTPVQSAAIPLALSGKDIIGVAQTGTGKTAAFCLPILNRLLQSPGKTALVLAPTRELAIQIDMFWRQLTQKIPRMYSVVVIGGASMHIQMRGLSRQPRLIVATPGRMIDHLDRRTVNIKAVDVLVLDEADRMLDMGFAPQLAEIAKHVPQDRQTLFFTATWEPALDRLAKLYLKDPARVTVGSTAKTTPQITQSLIATTAQKKNDTLLDELNRRQGSVLVFAKTQIRTERLAHYLEEYGVPSNRIHGGRSQGQRNSALNAFRRGDIRVLVATDIAARGIDVTDIAHVVNYDLPQVPEDYIHRIGRTGRAGAKGEAISLVTFEDKHLWRNIARLLQKNGSAIPQVPQEFQISQPRSHARPQDQSGGGPRPSGRPSGGPGGRPTARPKGRPSSAAGGRGPRHSRNDSRSERPVGRSGDRRDSQHAGGGGRRRNDRRAEFQPRG